jgi:hypothetical protein
MFGRRFFWEWLAWVVPFVVTVAVAKDLARLWPEGSPWRVLALAPAVAAMSAGMWVELRQIARMDELHRLMYLIATLTGSMFAILFCAMAYIGEALQFWERVAPIYVIAALGVGFAVGWVAARRRYA